MMTIRVYRVLADGTREPVSHAASLSPFVVTGDGAGGWPSGAPYDRIIATCRLSTIPPTLLRQLTTDGLLLTPLGGALALLRPTGSDSAEGRLLARAFFMAMRRGGADTGISRRPPLPDVLARPSQVRAALLADNDFRSSSASSPLTSCGSTTSPRTGSLRRRGSGRRTDPSPHWPPTAPYGKRARAVYGH